MSTPSSPPSSAGPSRTVLVIGAVVVALLVIGAVVVRVLAGGDDGPTPVAGGDPTTGASGSPVPTGSPTAVASASPEGELAPAYATVVSLQQISTDYGNQWDVLDGLYQDKTLDGSDVDAAKTAYDSARTTYVDAVTTLGEQVASDPTVSAAYAEFRPDALGTIRYMDDVLAFRRAGVTCLSVITIGLLDKPAHQKKARLCRREAAPLLDAPAPGVVAFATGYRALMLSRIKAFDTIKTSDDFFENGAAVTTRLTGEYTRFKPTITKTVDALKKELDDSTVAESYPAVLLAIEQATGIK